VPNRAQSQADSPKEPRSRFAFIDGLRGIAALSVVLFHLRGPRQIYPDAFAAVFPQWFLNWFGYGWLGVQVFFVLSGFVIAYSLRATPVIVETTKAFFARRLLRLCPPYWATIAAVIAIDAASNLVLVDRYVPFPGLGTVLANATYVQNLFGLPELAPVFWTLALEIQLYFVLLLVLAVGQRRAEDGTLPPNRIAIRLAWIGGAASAIVSMTLDADQLLKHSNFASYWYMFALGALAYWCGSRQAPASLLLAGCALLMLSQFGIGIRAEFLAVAVTALALYAVTARGALGRTLTSRPLQYLGRISYSLYLLHTIVGGRVQNLGERLTGHDAALRLVWFVLALAASIVAADLLYRWVEAPSIGWAKSLKTSRRGVAPSTSAS
jgi:peptidoglycan/LPS O-acetylase OafA/YrhL